GDLVERGYAHKLDLVQGFITKYGENLMVYYEPGSDYEGTHQREKQIKEWERQGKIELIERENPEWRDLYKDIL
ncbi:MAG: GIY-YIG nuclease family protein, partial [Dehalococcoidia bacterium]|nr:GIY-YIG nuclease family protein [Dehalococcoidia bacterium]